MPRSAPPVLDFTLSPENEKLLTERVIAARDVANAEALLRAAEERLKERGSLGMAFDAARAGREDRVLVVPDASSLDGDLWFLGDLHGDLLAFETALFHIESQPRSDLPPVVVLLGDLIDDGIDAYPLLLAVLQRAIEKPEAICVVAGNHDEGLDHDGEHFFSTTEPCDFAHWLNEHEDDLMVGRLGRLAIHVFRSAPRALFFPDGLLAAHAGFPLEDLHETIKTRADLEDPRCLQDFTWTRAHPTAPHKIPNRHNKGCQFGYQDFGLFCDHASKVLGIPVERMIRGHDHFPSRYFDYPSYRTHPMLTINTMSHRLAREGAADYRRPVCVARYREGRLPDVHLIPLSAEITEALYPPPS